MASIICAILLSIGLALSQLVAPNNDTLPTSFFWTRPQAYAPAMKVSQKKPGVASNEYIFIAPYQHPGAGPYIYDKLGNLVWDGFGIAGPANAQDFHVCSYLGKPHLCFVAVNQQQGYGAGQGVIFDGNRIVASVQTGNAAMPADQHEFQLVDNGAAALLTFFQTVAADLVDYGIFGQGWLLGSGFQKVNVMTGELLFEWYSTDHVYVSDSVVPIGTPNASPGDTNGFTPATGFDYFHINSIDQTPSGNFMVSARHTSGIYYINGRDGSIIWRLSCIGRSDFTCTNFNFSYQHDARLVSENATTTVFTMFDNAKNNAANASSPSSAGRIISLDHISGKATQLLQFLPAVADMISPSQGNFQTLGNGNYFIGWGSNPYVSEYDSQGNLLFAANWAEVSSHPAMSYRSFSFPWTSTPANTKPAVYAYALNSSSATHVWVSWNGATEVVKWRFYGYMSNSSPYRAIGETDKVGFETAWTAPAFYPWIMAEALDASGTSLRNSSFQSTFVPGPALAAACNITACSAVNAYGTPVAESSTSYASPSMPTSTRNTGDYTTAGSDPTHTALSVTSSVLPHVKLSSGSRKKPWVLSDFMNWHWI